MGGGGAPGPSQLVTAANIDLMSEGIRDVSLEKPLEVTIAAVIGAVLPSDRWASRTALAIASLSIGLELYPDPAPPPGSLAPAMPVAHRRISTLPRASHEDRKRRKDSARHPTVDVPAAASAAAAILATAITTLLQRSKKIHQLRSALACAFITLPIRTKPYIWEYSPGIRLGTSRQFITPLSLHHPAPLSLRPPPPHTGAATTLSRLYSY